MNSNNSVEELTNYLMSIKINHSKNSTYPTKYYQSANARHGAKYGSGSANARYGQKSKQEKELKQKNRYF